MSISMPDIGQRCLVAESPTSKLEVQIITYIYPALFNPQGNLSAKKIPPGATIFKTGGLNSTELYLDRNGIASLFTGPFAYLRLNGKDNSVTLKSSRYSNITAGSITTVTLDEDSTFHKASYYINRNFDDPLNNFVDRIIEERGENEEQDGFLYKQEIQKISTPVLLEPNIHLYQRYGLSNSNEIYNLSGTLPKMSYSKSIGYGTGGESINFEYTDQPSVIKKYSFYTALNNSDSFLRKEDIEFGNYLYHDSLLNTFEKSIQYSYENSNLYTYNLTDSGYEIKYQFNGSILYKELFDSTGFILEISESSNSTKTTQQPTQYKIENDTTSITLTKEDVKIIVGDHTFLINSEGLTFNGKALVFEDLVDFINTYKATLGQGNMGAPVPLFAPAQAEFATTFGGTPTTPKSFKTKS